jgi:TatD DNase family protein
MMMAHLCGMEAVSHIIDTHAHIYLDEFKSDLSSMLDRARDAGVERIYMPGIASADIPDLLQTEAMHPGLCRAMMGLHPCYVGEDYKAELDIVADWLSKRPFAAVGEVGLDFHWDLTHVEAQREAFSTQVGWAADLGLPVVIHSRKSTDACIDIIRGQQDGRLKGIFHCFSGTADEAREIIDLGFYLGIGGVLTYKNGGLAPVIEAVGLDRLVLETDAPYLTPVPFRGKRNEPAHLKLVAQRLSDIAGLPYAEVAAITTRNAQAVFGA